MKTLITLLIVFACITSQAQTPYQAPHYQRLFVEMDQEVRIEIVTRQFQTDYEKRQQVRMVIGHLKKLESTQYQILLYKLYQIHCYNDSTLQHECVRRDWSGMRFEYQSIQLYTHREPTPPGYIEWLKKLIK